MHHAFYEKNYEIENLIQEELIVFQKKDNTETKSKNQNNQQKALYEKYLERIQRWYDNPEEAYEEHCIEYNKEGSEKDFELMVKFHTFSNAVDYFVLKYGISCTLNKNNETTLSHNISGQLIYYDNNKEKVVLNGIFSYGVNKDGELYHKSFSQTVFDQIKEKIENLRE